MHYFNWISQFLIFLFPIFSKYFLTSTGKFSLTQGLFRSMLFNHEANGNIPVTFVIYSLILLWSENSL